MKIPTAKEYAAALLKADFHALQKKALLAVYSLPDHKASARQIASLVGFESWRASNLAFGIASKKVAGLLGVNPPERNERNFHYWSVLSEGDESGTEFAWKLRKQVVAAIEQIGWHKDANYFIPHADEAEAATAHYEGAAIQVRVTIYERSREARARCLVHHGCKCAVCDFEFESFYGEIGRDYIHVHHLVPIAEIGERYVINPVKDLIPVCPNCHAMIHAKSPPLAIEDLKHRIKQ